jgi:hypothetical protein
VVLGPVLLSLIMGLWFQSRTPTKLATIQTARGIASQIVTTGSCEFSQPKNRLRLLLTRTVVAALLATLSSVGDK